MNKQEFIQKIVSRKFWLVLITLVISLCALLNTPEDTTNKIITTIGAFSTLVIYIYSQGKVDVADLELSKSKLDLVNTLKSNSIDK